MRRREFLGLLGGATAVWPFAARGQQGDRIRRVGALSNLASDDPEGQARLAAFLQGLQEAGWSVGRNVRVDIRWGTSDIDLIRKFATEMVALAPDVILASGGVIVGPLLQVAGNVPIVFTVVPDPVAGGFVASLARPGRNATGFTSGEFGTSAKWLEVLKEIAPRVARAAVLYDTVNPAGTPQFAAIQAVASSFGVELTRVGLRNAGDIERDLTAFAQLPKSGLIVTRTAEAIAHRELIIALAARHKLPAVYPLRFFTTNGGLVSYGPDIVDQHRLAAGYIDRILRGQRPADLPVQHPTKYELVLNLKTAKALGIEMPDKLLARADEVIE